MRNLLVKLIATVFGVGFLPAAPGTWATIAGVGIAYCLGSNLPAYSIVLLVLLVLGIMASGILEKQLNQKDPGIVVIDEVVGVMIALWGLPLIWPVMIIGFFLFRAFDMFKIYPINKLEAQNGGWGIMLDDCMAGVYTNIILRIALRCAGLF
jgi:phosphatidylglycerophosphatase A